MPEVYVHPDDEEMLQKMTGMQEFTPGMLEIYTRMVKRKGAATTSANGLGVDLLIVICEALNEEGNFLRRQFFAVTFASNDVGDKHDQTNLHSGKSSPRCNQLSAG